MSRKGHIAGRRIAPSHGTVTSLVQEIADFLKNRSTVVKVVPGVITPINGRQCSEWTVKFQDHEGNMVLVTATMKRSVQELRFYTRNKQDDMLALAKWVKKRKWWLLIEKPIK